MNAYSIAVAEGGNAATMLQEMVPKPVRPMEDPNAMAAFIEDMSSKTQKLADEDNNMSGNHNFSPAHNSDLTLTTSNEANDGADFAAKFALEIDA